MKKVKAPNLLKKKQTTKDKKLAKLQKKSRPIKMNLLEKKDVALVLSIS